jgi:predicted ester cyclase
VTAEHNKQIVKQLFEDAINHHKPALFDALISAEYVGPAGDRGPAAFAAVIGALTTGFPDIQYRLEDVFAGDDRVAVRWTWSGTHTGRFREFAATNRPVTNAGMAIFELRDGKIVRQWLETDRLGFLQAMGVVSPELGKPPQPAARR